jgi:hypothetical protein
VTHSHQQKLADQMMSALGGHDDAQTVSAKFGIDIRTER